MVPEGRRPGPHRSANHSRPDVRQGPGRDAELPSRAHVAQSGGRAGRGRRPRRPRSAGQNDDARPDRGGAAPGAGADGDIGRITASKQSMTIAAGRLRTPASRMKMGKYACVPLNGSQWLWLAWSWYGWTLALARSTRGRTFGPPQPNCLAGRRRLARWADQATTEARAIILVPRAGSGEMSDEARQCCGADFCRRALGKCSRARSVGPPDWRPKGVLRGGQEFATGGIWRWSSRVAYRMAMRSWGGLRMRARGGRRRLQRSQPKPCPFA